MLTSSITTWLDGQTSHLDLDLDLDVDVDLDLK
jgi:hypothetical protein